MPIAQDAEKKVSAGKWLVSVTLFILLSAIVIPNYFHARSTALAKQHEAEIEYRNEIDASARSNKTK